MKLLKYKNLDVVPVVEIYENHSLRLELIDIDTGTAVKEITTNMDTALPYGYAAINDCSDTNELHSWLKAHQIINQTGSINNGCPIATVNMFRLFELDNHGTMEYQKYFIKNLSNPDFVITRKVYPASEIYKAMIAKGVSA